MTTFVTAEPQLFVLDVAPALHAEYQKARVELAQPLKAEAWGARTFIVRDPDGNLPLFASTT